MNLIKTLTRYALYMVLALVLLTGCYQRNDRKMYVWLKYDSGLNYSSTKVYCDSVQMVSISEAYIFIDGVKQRVLAERVRPCSN
jgi:hypothetical protein